MTYYIYHIPGKKIGITTNLKKRVEEQQGYQTHEYDIILSTDDVNIASEAEISLQRAFGYRVDETPYNKLKFNKEENDMNINVTEATTTFPCPANKLKGQLMDNLGMTWHTDHGTFTINKYSIDWIIKNIQVSRYNDQRSYVYNKAFARFYDNHQTHDTVADAHMKDRYPSNGHETRTGGLAPTGMQERKCDDCQCNKGECLNPTQFDLIRTWAEERGLYEKGDPKTQSLKLVEEVGEICRATLKEDLSLIHI